MSGPITGQQLNPWYLVTMMAEHQLARVFLLVSLLCNAGTILDLVSSADPYNEQTEHVETVSLELNSTLTGRVEAKTFGLIRDLLFGPTTTTTTTTTTTAAPAVIVISDSCRCGIKTGNRILGGLEAEVSFEMLFPWNALGAELQKVCIILLSQYL